MTIKQRPKHLNLFKIRFPVTAIASILHRVSGAFMFLLTPFLIYFFALSLKSPLGFEAAVNWLYTPFMQLVFIVLIWSLIHHLLMGIRFLLVDFDLGIELSKARISALGVTIAGIIIAFVFIRGMYS